MIKKEALPPAVSNFDNLPDSAFVRLPVLRAIFGGRSSASIYRDVADGRLPSPVALGPRCSGWRVGDLRAAIAELSESATNRAASSAQAKNAGNVSVAKRRTANSIAHPANN